MTTLSDIMRLAVPLHPSMQAESEGGYYRPNPLRPVARNDTNYIGPGFQRYNSPERKASGFYGELGSPNDIVSEYSSGGDNGEAQFPQIYPGMSRDRLNAVLDAALNNRRTPDYIYNAAQQAGQDRMAQGLSPFWNRDQDQRFKP